MGRMGRLLSTYSRYSRLAVVFGSVEHWPGALGNHALSHS